MDQSTKNAISTAVVANALVVVGAMTVMEPTNSAPISVVSTVATVGYCIAKAKKDS